MTTIQTSYEIKRDLLLDQIAEDNMMKLKIHAHHSTHETFKSAIRVLLLEFLVEMNAINNNQKG